MLNNRSGAVAVPVWGVFQTSIGEGGLSPESMHALAASTRLVIAEVDLQVPVPVAPPEYSTCLTRMLTGTWRERRGADLFEGPAGITGVRQ